MAVLPFCGKSQLHNNETLLIINCYMPTDDRRKNADQEFEDTLVKVDQLCQQCNCDKLIVGGDLNVDLRRKTANTACLIEAAYQCKLHFLWDLPNAPIECTFLAPNMNDGSKIYQFLVTESLMLAVLTLMSLEYPSSTVTGH